MKALFALLFRRGDSSKLVKRLIGEYVVHQRRHLFMALFCMIIVAAATATNAWLMQPVLDKIFLERNEQMLMIVPLAVLTVAILNALAEYGNVVNMRYVGQRIIADLQLALFRHLIHADLSMFYDKGSGQLISRFTNDIQMMRAAVSNVLTGIAKETLTMIFLLGVMIYQSWQLSIIALVVFPIAGLPVIKLGRRMRKISADTQKELGAFTGRLDETFAGVRMVKAYNREDYETGRAYTVIESLFRLYIKSARVMAAVSPIMSMLGGIAIAAIIWYGGAQVLAGVTTPGAFFSFIAAMILAYRPAKALGTLNANLQEGLAAARRLFDVLDAPPTIRDKPNAIPLDLRDGHIRFDNVSFHYPGGAGVDKVSFEVPKGKMVALVGPSGGGKSTILNLLLRFYDAEEGRITIDGSHIRDVTLSSLRSACALVSQEIILFDDTVRANIRYGRLDATDEEVERAARAAAADEFIDDMPDGYDTLIGPHGLKLSGGQRQRIALARAILKDAPILLLDEATSALDTQSERSVQEALGSLMGKKTALVIAHRLSTVRHADRIVVVLGGRVVESGTHDELLRKGGEYYRLYGRQFEAGMDVFS